LTVGCSHPYVQNAPPRMPLWPRRTPSSTQDPTVTSAVTVASSGTAHADGKRPTRRSATPAPPPGVLFGEICGGVALVGVAATLLSHVTASRGIPLATPRGSAQIKSNICATAVPLPRDQKNPNDATARASLLLTGGGKNDSLWQLTYGERRQRAREGDRKAAPRGRKRARKCKKILK
jgi:hypothetical protein